MAHHCLCHIHRTDKTPSISLLPSSQHIPQQWNLTASATEPQAQAPNANVRHPKASPRDQQTQTTSSPTTPTKPQPPSNIMRIFTIENILLVAATLNTTVHAGPAAYGICQAGCAAVVVACYSAAGAVFGVAAPPAAVPAVLACNSAFGTCQAACCAAGLAPTP
ncbi:hypothetical protein BST61_g1324 [Cercospora zeina]